MIATANEPVFGRYELGHTDEISWIAVPIREEIDGKLVSVWETYIKDKSGRRTLQFASDLPAFHSVGGRKLWLNEPGRPGPVEYTWSKASRDAWIAGTAKVDPVELFKRICDRISAFVWFPEESAEGNVLALALWTMQTYMYPAFDAVALMHLRGTPDSAKSRTKDVLKCMVFRPLSTSNISAAGIYRYIEDFGGTLLFDEMEYSQRQSDNERERDGLLRAGYRKGEYAHRCVKETNDGRMRVVAFDVYGPKLIASISRQQHVLASRCIRIRTLRAPKGTEQTRRRFSDDDALFQDIRDDLHVLALEHGPTWVRLAKWNGVPDAINARDFELYQPLLAIAHWLEEQGAVGVVRGMEAFALGSISELKDVAFPRGDEILLKLLTKSVQGKTNDTLTATQLLNFAGTTAGDPEFFKHWTAAGVGSALSKYHVGSLPKGKKRTFWPVTLQRLWNIQDTYGVDLGISPDEVKKVVDSNVDGITPISGSGDGMTCVLDGNNGNNGIPGGHPAKISRRGKGAYPA